MSPERDTVGEVEPVPASSGFLIAVLVLLFLGALLLAREFLGAIVLGLLVGFLMYPLQARLTPLVRWPSLAATILTIAFTLAVVLPIAFIARTITSDARLVMQLAREDRLEPILSRLLERMGMESARADALVESALSELGGFLQGAAVETLTGLAHFLAGLLVFYFVLFFAMRDGKALVEMAREYTPLRPRTRDRLFALVGGRVRAIALGTFLVAAIQGVVAGIGWWIFGFPAPVFWGFVMTVLAVLPLGAPFFVLLPASLWALYQGDWFSGIGLLVWTGIVVGLVDDALRPWIVGRTAGVHPAIILVGTLGGLLVWGVSGFLLGPLLLSMIGPVLRVWADQRRNGIGTGEGQRLP